MSRAAVSWRLSLPMYNVTPALAAAWESLLQAVIDGLARRGWTDTMTVVPQPDDLMAFWGAPDLLLSQTCGYPLVTTLRSGVRVLAVPEFDLPGCDGIDYRSVILVPEQGARSLQALRGSVAAINQPHSHSGMNALRHLIAPFAQGGRFFSRVAVSGGHLASIAMLQCGQAAVAAVDCITYQLALLHAPEQVAGVRVLQYSAPAPGLPLIASIRLSDAQVRDLLAVTLALPETAAPVLQALSVRRFRDIGLSDYDPVREHARVAAEQGYAELG